MSILKAAILAAIDPLLLVLPASQIPVEWDFGVPGASKCCCQLSVFAIPLDTLLHLRQAQTLQQEAADPPCGCSIPAIPIPGFFDGM